MRNNIPHYRFLLASLCMHPVLYGIGQPPHMRTVPHATITRLDNKSFEMATINMLDGSNQLTVFTAPVSTKTLLLRLDYDPKPTAHHIILSDIAQITIPYPYAVWHYNRGIRKHAKYLLIEVTFCNTHVAPCSYLVQRKTAIRGMQKNRKQSMIEKNIPLRATKKIIFNTKST